MSDRKERRFCVCGWSCAEGESREHDHEARMAMARQESLERTCESLHEAEVRDA